MDASRVTPSLHRLVSDESSRWSATIVAQEPLGILVTTIGEDCSQPIIVPVAHDSELRSCGLVRPTGMNTNTKPSNTEAVTLSLPAGLGKRARLLAAARETSLSRLVAELLAAKIDEELPGLLLNFKRER